MYQPLVPYALDPIARQESARDMYKFSAEIATMMYGAARHAPSLDMFPKPAYDPALILADDILAQLVENNYKPVEQEAAKPSKVIIPKIEIN